MSIIKANTGICENKRTVLRYFGFEKIRIVIDDDTFLVLQFVISNIVVDFSRAVIVRAAFCFTENRSVQFCDESLDLRRMMPCRIEAVFPR